MAAKRPRHPRKQQQQGGAGGTRGPALSGTETQQGERREPLTHRLLPPSDSSHYYKPRFTFSLHLLHFIYLIFLALSFT